MTIHEFWRCMIAEMRCGWSVFIHGPEFWLGVAIWGLGACFGVLFSWAAVSISDHKENQKNEEAQNAAQLTAEQTEQEE